MTFASQNNTGYADPNGTDYESPGDAIRPTAIEETWDSPNITWDSLIADWDGQRPGDLAVQNNTEFAGANNTESATPDRPEWYNQNKPDWSI